MPKTGKQLNPLLTLFETSSGCYSLRLSEVSKRATFLSIEVAKLLPDAKLLQVITPDDMKVFDFQGDETQIRHQTFTIESPEKKGGDFSPPPEMDESGMPPNPFEETGPPTSMDQVIEIAHEEEQKSNGQEKRYRSPKPRLGKMAGFDEPCGRCHGTGQIFTSMEGGQQAMAACPVCQGDKVIRRFGAKR